MRRGEGIMPAGVAVLERAGLREAVGGKTLASVRYHGFGMSAESGFPARGAEAAAAPAVGLGVRRLHLDAVLLAAARAAPGVRVYEQTAVEGAAIEGGRADRAARGRRGAARRAGRAADGLESPVRRSLGLDARRPADRRVGVRMHFRLAAGQTGPSRLEIFVGRGYELYAAPLPDGELLLAALGARDLLAGGARAAFARWIADRAAARGVAGGRDAR